MPGNSGRLVSLGFPFESIVDPAMRSSVMGRVIDFLVPIDCDGDGAANAADCLPFDPSGWAPPGRARDLLAEGDVSTTLSWEPPTDPGATTVAYDLLRASSPNGFPAGICLTSESATPSGEDASDPPPGTAFFFAVRARNRCGANFGADSGGLPREGADCPETCASSRRPRGFG